MTYPNWKFHATMAREWVGFDDVRSIDIKVKYLMDKGLGGAMFFSLDNDDYLEICFQEQFPLLKAINHHLNPKLQFEYPEPNVVFNPVQNEISERRMEKLLIDYFKNVTPPAYTGKLAMF